MPITECSDIFLVASVGVFDQHPIFNKKDGHKNWLIDKLNEYNSLPFISYIQPQYGYGDTIKKKFEKMDTMARFTRLITGDNKNYIDKDGIKIRNFIWSFCASNSIGNVILNAISKGEIGKIKIYIDDKSFTHPSKLLFINNLFKVLTVLGDSINKEKGNFPIECNILLERIKRIEGNISLYWRDESDAQIAKSGLILAHYLGYHFRKDFQKDNRVYIADLLIKNNYKHFQMNMTDLLTKPINRKTVEDWKKNTGLPEPN